jgi:hypothetical protein
MRHAGLDSVSSNVIVKSAFRRSDQFLGFPEAYTGNKMAASTFRSKPHADVLRRVFDLPGHGMTPALAEGILALDFPEDDAVRIAELSVRANEGQLTDDEQSELEAYVNVSDLLAYWQSKARQSVQHQT